MTRPAVLMLGAWLFVVAAASSQQGPPKSVDMADVQVGKPFPYPPFNTAARDTMADQLGFYYFNAPNAAQSALPFSHYQVAINSSSRVVYYVSGVRPYDALNLCHTALQSVAAFSRARYGVPKKLSKPGHFDEVVDDLRVEADCSYGGMSPYPELRFRVVSISQDKVLEDLRRKRYAR